MARRDIEEVVAVSSLDAAYLNFCGGGDGAQENVHLLVSWQSLVRFLHKKTYQREAQAKISTVNS
jgi:hypothetical protein